MESMSYLRPNKSTATPSNLAFFDCETLPEGGGGPTDYGLHKLNFGYARACRLEGGQTTRSKQLRFTTSADFWDWLATLCRPKSCLWVFAHNLGFDATIVNLWERIESGELSILRTKEKHQLKPKPGKQPFQSMPLVILDDPPTVIELTDRAGNRYKFVDTLNYWRCSLATLGKGIGLEKLDMPDIEDTQESWNNYCSRDVEIIEQAILGLLRWVKECDLGKFRLTSPSQAMAAFRHRFLDHKILFHENKQARKIERESYFGGQVECYTLGKVNSQVHQLDVTSLYPSVMRGELYPWRLKAFHPASETKELIPFDHGMDKIAQVWIDTCERTYPKREKDGIYHCTGTYQTTLAGAELEYALTNRHIRCVMDWSEYNISYLFDSYVNHFWQARKAYQLADNQLGDLLCKLLLNSLYGKFGQLGSEWEVLPDNPFPIRWGSTSSINSDTGEITEYQVLGDVCRSRNKAAEIPTAFTAIAAYVTAYGRQRMFDLRQVAGESEVHYQAVDALYVTDLGLARLQAAGTIGHKELGKLHLVGSIPTAEFRGINNYAVGSKQVRGSIKPSAKEIEPDTWEAPHFQHLASILNGPLQGGVQISRGVKTMNNAYTRRVATPSGRTAPIAHGIPPIPCRATAADQE